MVLIPTSARSVFGLLVFFPFQTICACEIDARKPETIKFSGVLTYRIFPGSPNFDDVRKGDQPEPGYFLHLDAATCASGLEVAGEGKHDVSTTRVQLLSDDQQIETAFRRLKGQHVSIRGKSLEEAFTGHHHAPLLIDVKSIEPDSDGGADLATPAKTVVQAFYQALAAGDGNEASRFIVPTKRRGGFSAEAMSRFYGTLKEPLALTEIRPLSQSSFEVTYQFRAANKSACDGHAIVSTVTDRGSNYITAIRSLSGC